MHPLLARSLPEQMARQSRSANLLFHMSNDPAKIVVLISGSGSNLQALIEAIAAGSINAQIVGVICNNAQAHGLKRAKSANIPTHIIKHNEFASREQFDHALISCIDQYQPRLVILAGFLRILSSQFVQYYLGKLLNIHPSLLPKYPGLNTHRRALEAGDTQHGASVHYVTENLDAGPIILQAVISILTDDNEQRLAQKTLTQEHRIYPLAVKWVIEQRVKLRQNKVEFDGSILTAPIQIDPVSGNITVNNKTLTET